MRSDPAGVVGSEGLVPEHEGTLAHEVVVAEGLAVLADPVLDAVEEVLGLLVAVRLEHAVQEDLLVLDAGRLVLVLRRAEQVIQRLEDLDEPPRKPLVLLLQRILSLFFVLFLFLLHPLCFQLQLRLKLMESKQRTPIIYPLFVITQYQYYNPSISLMKSFQREVSPIQHKYPRTQIYCEEMAERIDMGQQPQHLTVMDNLDWTYIEHRIVTAAKTIVYLFTPEIDLLQSIEHNIANYDKYQKTRLILKELVGGLQEGRLEFQTEILKTHSEMQKMEAEISYFRTIVGRLQDQCTKRDQTILKQKQTIVQLTEAYREAKKCYEQELSELRERSTEFKINIRGNRSSEEKEKNVRRSSRDHHTLKVPKKRRQSDAYTDRSMYKRFSASNIPQAQQEQKVQPRSNSSQKTPEGTYLLKIEQLEFQKETLQRKIGIVQSEFKQLAFEYSEAKQKHSQKIQAVAIEIDRYRQEGTLFKRKLQEKNRIIQDLLAVVEGRA